MRRWPTGDGVTAPIAITKVVFPDGHTDDNWGTPHRVKVLSEGVTAEETSILEQNVQSGTATRSAIACPTAAKTGTTSELVDAWLDGYTPRYSTVVWMGYPNKRVSMTDVHGEPQQGGYLPAEIWHAYMSAVTEGKPCVPFPPAKESISYEPFYGKFASTGYVEAPREAEVSTPKKKPSSGGHGEHGAGPSSERETGAEHGTGDGGGGGGKRSPRRPAGARSGHPGRPPEAARRSGERAVPQPAEISLEQLQTPFACHALVV